MTQAPSKRKINVVEETKEEAKPFRIQNQKLMLTYKTHLDKKKFEAWFLDSCDSYTIKFFRMAHENGHGKDSEEAEFSYEHTHVLVDFGKAFQTRDCRRFDYEKIHPHIKLIKLAKHWESAIQYIAKEDPDNADLKKENSNLVMKVLKEKNLLDALTNNVNKFCDVQGIVKIFETCKKQERKRKVKPIVLREWQEDVVKYCQEEPNDRKVLWICDKIGGAGKSTLLKHMRNEWKDEVASFTECGKIADLCNNIANAVNNGWTGRICVFDLARAYEDRDTVYHAIELVKNGTLTLTKYKGGEVEIPQETHVIIFANFMPKVKKLSWDRWDIREIDKTVMRPVNIKDIQAADDILDKLGCE